MDASPAGKARGDQAGQTLILFVFALAALLGFTALATDVGLILHERRQLQNAADAAALAGAQELFDSPTAAVAMAQQYAEANGVDLTDPTYTFQATTPYQGDSGKIEVTVSKQVGFLFGRVLGLDFADVPARAVAKQPVITITTKEYALFAETDSCSANNPLLISGSDNAVIGFVHSNSKIVVSGSDNSFNGPTTLNCGFADSGANNTYIPPPEQQPNRYFATNYTWSSFCFPGNPDLVIPIQTQPTDLNSVPEAWVGGNESSNQLKDGVFCSTDDVVISGSGVSGNVTLVAGDEIKLTGSDFNLTAYDEDVLAFSSASHENAIDMSGSGGSWIGLIIAPNGRARVQGSGNLSVNGGVMAESVTVSGSDFSIKNEGFPVTTYGPVAVRLIE